jgi:hypothetical protein
MIKDVIMRNSKTMVRVTFSQGEKMLAKHYNRLF